METICTYRDEAVWTFTICSRKADSIFKIYFLEWKLFLMFAGWNLVPVEGLEPPTFCLEGNRSIRWAIRANCAGLTAGFDSPLTSTGYNLFTF